MSDSQPFVVSLSVWSYRGTDFKKHQRVDSFLAGCFPELSRVTIQDWIKSGEVQVDEKSVKPSFAVQGGEQIHIDATFLQVTDAVAQESHLEVVYEDDDLLVINKPVGLVVHPGAGNPDHTLLNYLLAYRSEQKELPRAGLVHRLDSGTSGLLMVAKNQFSYNILQQLIKDREVKRDYIALVEGMPISGDTIDMPIGRDPKNRLRMRTYKMGAAPSKARNAVTHFRVKEKFSTHGLLDVSLETGRTHQIRTHLQTLGFPIVGDGFYGWHRKLPLDANDELRDAIRSFSHPALHAASLSFIYKPNVGGEKAARPISLQAEMPSDMAKLVRLLRDNRDSGL